MSAVIAWLILAASAGASGFTVVREATVLDVRRTGHYTETVERTLRIDSLAGVRDHDQWSLAYSPERTTMQVLEAWTQTSAGQRIPVPPDRIIVRERDSSDRFNLFTGWQTLVVVYPHVEIGSLLHIRWRATHAPLYPGHFAWRRTLDPSTPPQDWSVRLTHEPGMPIRVQRFGLAGGALAREPRGSGNYEFRVDKEEIAKTISSRSKEPEGPWLRVGFSTFASWSDVARAYRDGAAEQATVTPTIRAHAREVTKDATSALERVRLLHDWVRLNVRYAGLHASRGGNRPFPAEDVLRNRYGDCKDKAVLLQALLGGIGISAHGVLIDDGLQENLPSLPIPSFFSHVMVHVPSMGLYLDPTAEELPMGVHYADYLGQPVLHVGSGRPGRMPGASPLRDTSAVETVMEMRPDGSIYGSSRSRLAGHVQVRWRYDLKDGYDGEGLVAKALTARGEWGSGNLDVMSEEHEPVLDVSMRFNLQPVVDLPGPALMRVPMGASPGGILRLARSPAERCLSERHIERTSLTLPRGHTVMGKLPPDASFRQGAWTYRSTYRVIQQADQARIDVTREYIADCMRSALSRDDRTTRDDLRGVMWTDLRAQVTIRKATSAR